MLREGTSSSSLEGILITAPVAMVNTCRARHAATQALKRSLVIEQEGTYTGIGGRRRGELSGADVCLERSREDLVLDERK